MRCAFLPNFAFHRVGDSSTVEQRTLPPSILVRSQVPQPQILRIVRRQSFWDRERLKIRESLAPLVCNIMRLADGAASGDWRLSVV
jgi:hypothetical protein